MVIHSFDHSEDAAQQCAEAIVDTIRKRIDSPLLFLYSGGSALSVLDRIAEQLSGDDLRSVIFAPVDERKDAAQSNVFAFSQTIGYQSFIRQGITVVSPNIQAGVLATVGDDYDKQIAALFTDTRNHDGSIITLLGMGKDGHTAGIFPFPHDCASFDLLFEGQEHFVVGYDVGERSEFSERITLTAHALRFVDITFVYVCGDEKRDALLASQGVGALCDVPARIWQQMRDVSVFTDIRL